MVSISSGLPWCRRVIEHRRQQIMRGGDGVEIAGEMQVDIRHRDHLRIAAARRAALHPEARARATARAARCRSICPILRSRIAQPDRGGGFPFARRGGRDGGDQDQLPIRPAPRVASARRAPPSPYHGHSRSSRLPTDRAPPRCREYVSGSPAGRSRHQ